MSSSSSSTSKIRYCGRCRIHGCENLIRGHKNVCEFKSCECAKCKIQTYANKLALLERRGQKSVDSLSVKVEDTGGGVMEEFDDNLKRLNGSSQKINENIIKTQKNYENLIKFVEINQISDANLLKCDENSEENATSLYNLDQFDLTPQCFYENFPNHDTSLDFLNNNYDGNTRSTQEQQFNAFNFNFSGNDENNSSTFVSQSMNVVENFDTFDGANFL